MKILLPVFFCVIAGTFTVNAQDLSDLKNQDPFKINGSIDIRTIGYTSKGMVARRSPFSYIISGSPTLSLYGFTIPVSFTFSEQDRSFQQPFNQFGLSPTYKWITLHGGFRNVSFSPYTLAGHTMLGGGFELNPGKFKVGFMTGRLNRATAIDTTTGEIRPEGFSRYGSAIKIGYGSDKSFINLSYLTAKDSERGFKGNIDSSLQSMASNNVFGADFKITFLKSLYIFGDGAVSLLTHNINSSLEIDIDSSRSGLSSIQKLFNLNGTSEYFLAYSGGLGYTSKYFSLKAAYKKVEPNFQSMGTYFFQNDLQNITLSPSFNALKGRLRFTGNFGIQADNQLKRKQATTRRVISMANLSWEITDKFGIDANYSNFSTNSEPTVTMVENKYLLAQTNQNMSLTPRVVLANATTTQVIMLSYNVNSLRDLNTDTTLSKNDILSSITLLNYNLTFNELGLSISAGVNYVNNKMEIGNISNQGVTLGATKSFLKNKLNISSQNAWTKSELTQGTGTILNLGGTASYMPFKGHRIGLRISSMSNNTENENSDPLKFSELTGELGYTYTF
jgi:hypothetical protein